MFETSLMWLEIYYIVVWVDLVWNDVVLLQVLFIAFPLLVLVKDSGLVCHVSQITVVVSMLSW